MRKVIYFLLFSFFGFSVKAQVMNKRDRLFGGSFSVSIFDIDNNGPGYSNAGNVGIFPSYAWAIKNDLLFGVKGSIGYNRTANENSVTKNTVNSFSVGPGLFLKKYKLLKNRFGIYFNNDGRMSYVVTKYKSSNVPDVKSESWGLSYNFQPGVFYKFSENFFGEGNLGGLYASYYGAGNTKNYGIGISFLQYFNLGINYRIERKR